MAVRGGVVCVFPELFSMSPGCAVQCRAHHQTRQQHTSTTSQWPSFTSHSRRLFHSIFGCSAQPSGPSSVFSPSPSQQICLSVWRSLDPVPFTEDVLKENYSPDRGRSTRGTRFCGVPAAPQYKRPPCCTINLHQTISPLCSLSSNPTAPQN